MNSPGKIAIIGSGASAIYLLMHLLDQIASIRKSIGSISIFEKGSQVGMGMPYSPDMADEYNMANIPSEEMPPLLTSLAEWLRNLENDKLQMLKIDRASISERAIYNRITLGQYLQTQYRGIITELTKSGLEIQEHANCVVKDLVDDESKGLATVVTHDYGEHNFDKVFIATGHCWPQEDKPEQGYFATPWPISKLVPKEGNYYNFSIGTLGASLSAFDVIASLAHRHGKFVKEDAEIKYVPNSGAEKFRIFMHAAHGRLPHLRYDIEETKRKIYQHVSREDLLKIVDEQGYLRIENYYEKVCRPTLRIAFAMDNLHEIVTLLEDDDFELEDFVKKMSEEHDYPDAFEGMRYEMVEARESVLGQKPIHWKEVVDDLIYTLNFHAELLPAEDHIVLQSVVMPFLMNVIAAMPLQSADKLLALHTAGHLEIVSGKVSVVEKPSESTGTSILVEDGEEEKEIHYRMFIDCSGQKPVELEDYPFPSLVKNGSVRKARASFADETYLTTLPEEKRDRVFKKGDKLFYDTSGIEIDGTYRIVGESGRANERIYDLAFPHTLGVRPYSYGLQSCSDTGAIIVHALMEEFSHGPVIEISQDEKTEIYEKV